MNTIKQGFNLSPRGTTPSMPSYAYSPGNLAMKNKLKRGSLTRTSSGHSAATPHPTKKLSDIYKPVETLGADTSKQDTGGSLFADTSDLITFGLADEAVGAGDAVGNWFSRGFRPKGLGSPNIQTVGKIPVSSVGNTQAPGISKKSPLQSLGGVADDILPAVLNQNKQQQSNNSAYSGERAEFGFMGNTANFH